MFIPSPDWFAQGARWARQGYRRVRGTASRDHTALWTGWYVKPYQGSFGSHFYSIAACAPSEHLRHPQEVRAARVHDFLSEHIPLAFPAQPFQSYPDMVMYEVKDDPSEPAAYAARVLPTGLVELFVRVPHEADANGLITINVADAFRPLAWLLDAVNKKGYKNLFGLLTTMRLLDWYVALTPSVSTNNGSHNWNDLRFPGRRPQIRGTQGATPNSGIEVRNRRQRAKPEGPLTTVVTQFVRKSGWDGDDVAHAVSDTVDSLLA